MRNVGRAREYSIPWLKAGRTVGSLREHTRGARVTHFVSDVPGNGNQGAAAKLICLLIYYRELIKPVSSVARGILGARDRCLSRGISIRLVQIHTLQELP